MNELSQKLLDAVESADPILRKIICALLKVSASGKHEKVF